MKVLEFISLIRDSYPEMQVEIFSKGACFSFYRILKAKYKSAVPYYDGNHVLTKIGKNFYDITGLVTPNEHHLIMKEEPTNWGSEYLERKKK